jgi:hypothetical protein
VGRTTPGTGDPGLQIEQAMAGRAQAVDQPGRPGSHATDPALQGLDQSESDEPSENPAADPAASPIAQLGEQQSFGLPAAQDTDCPKGIEHRPITLTEISGQVPEPAGGQASPANKLAGGVVGLIPPGSP